MLFLDKYFVGGRVLIVGNYNSLKSRTAAE